MDDVLRFLLGQIALYGKSGALPSEVFDFLKSYPWPHHHVAAPEEAFPGADISFTASTLPEPTTESVLWNWLARHPGLLVGKDGQANHLPLDEVRSQNELAIATCRAEHDNVPGCDIRSLHCSTSVQTPILRLYATEENIWQAVAGHGVDPGRVPPQDFDCLCVIAQHGEAGVLQPSLVRLTSQDPRSVPVRTQRLCDGGYVLKIPTTVNSVRSSLLILKKFAHLLESGVAGPTEADQKEDVPDLTTPVRLVRSKYADHEQMIREALTILEESRLIVWDDLKKKIGIYRDARRSKSLRKALRRLEELGFVTRAKAQGAQDTSAFRHHCMKFLRRPTETDLSIFFSGTHVEGNAPSLEGTIQSQSLPATVMCSDPQIQWSASRQLAHIIRDAVDAAGNDGLTSQRIKEAVTGLTYDRPVEHLLSRLVDSPKTSQPAHLLHLGLLRDTAALARTSVFMHYARHRLESLLEEEKVAKDTSLAAPSQLLQVDSFGFPPVIEKTSLKARKKAKFPPRQANLSKPKENNESNGKDVRTRSSTGRPRGRPRKDARAHIAGEEAPSLEAREPFSQDQAGEHQSSFLLNDGLEQSQESRRHSKRPNASVPTSFPKPSSENDRALTYNEQDDLIMRSSTGVFVGHFFELRRPGLRGRRPKSRLAIIKSPRLLELAWFTRASSTQAESQSPRNEEVSDIELSVALMTSGVVERTQNLGSAGEAKIGPTRKPESSNPIATLQNGGSMTELAPRSSESDGVPAIPQNVELQDHSPMPPQKSHSASRPQATTGAVAAKRRQIILDIMNDVGGVYPGGNELWYPFATLWQKYTQGTQPDTKTVRNIVSALVDYGTLRRITFNYQNKHGMVIVKTLLTLPEIAPDDERVKKVQERMIAAEPRAYLPEEIDVAPELKPGVKKPSDPPQSTAIPIEKEKVDMQYVPAYRRRKRASRTDTNNTDETKPKRRRTRKIEGTTSIETNTNEPSEPNSKQNRTQTVERTTLADTNANEDFVPSKIARLEGGLTQQHYSADIQPYSTYRPRNPQPILLDFPMINAGRIEPTQPVTVAPTPDSPSSKRTRQSSSVASASDSPTRKRAPPQRGTKPRRLTSLMDTKRSPLRSPMENQDTFRRMRARGPLLETHDEAWNLRVYIASLIVKLLLGGIEQTVDWRVVASMLENKMLAVRLPKRWNHIRDSFKEMGEAMHDELREKLAAGFERGSLVCVDYDDIHAYDWKGLLDWTLASIDPSRFSGGLPTSRATLLQRYDVTVAETPSLAGYYEDSIKTTLAKRRVLLHKHAYVEDWVSSLKSNTAESRQSLARSWIHAVMTTPDAEYDAEAANRKLAQLTEQELIETVKFYRAEKIITAENRGRLVPARGYDFSDRYLTRLKSSVEADQLRQAAKFKKSLDADLESSGRSRFDLNSRDGAFLALINMMSQDQVRMAPGASFPTSSDLIDSGYVTRQMDKSRLVFAFDLEPTSLFRSGNPLDMSVEPPRCHHTLGDTDDEHEDMTRIPMWYDMNGKVVPIMWEVARAMVAIQLGVRPGLTLLPLSDAVKPVLQPFEVELVLRWFVDIGAATYATGSKGNVLLKEWWWMVLADVIE